MVIKNPARRWRSGYTRLTQRGAQTKKPAAGWPPKGSRRPARREKPKGCPGGRYAGAGRVGCATRGSDPTAVRLSDRRPPELNRRATRMPSAWRTSNTASPLRLKGVNLRLPEKRAGQSIDGRIPTATARNRFIRRPIHRPYVSTRYGLVLPTTAQRPDRTRCPTGRERRSAAR